MKSKLLIEEDIPKEKNLEKQYLFKNQTLFHLIIIEAIIICLITVYYKYEIQSLSNNMEEFKLNMITLLQTSKNSEFYQKDSEQSVLCTCTDELSQLNSSIIGVNNTLSSEEQNLNNNLQSLNSQFTSYSAFVNNSLKSLTNKLNVLAGSFSAFTVTTNLEIGLLTANTTQLTNQISAVNNSLYSFGNQISQITNSLNASINSLVANSLSGQYQITQFPTNTIVKKNPIVITYANISISEPGYMICSGNLNYNYASNQTEFFTFNIYLNNVNQSIATGCSSITHNHCFVSFSEIMHVSNLTKNISLYAYSNNAEFDLAWLPGSGVYCNLFT